MKDYDDGETFFEEDEPAEKIVAAFDRGPQGVTACLYEVVVPTLSFGGSTPIVQPRFVFPVAITGVSVQSPSELAAAS